MLLELLALYLTTVAILTTLKIWPNYILETPFQLRSQSKTTSDLLCYKEELRPKSSLCTYVNITFLSNQEEAEHEDLIVSLHLPICCLGYLNSNIIIKKQPNLKQPRLRCWYICISLETVDYLTRFLRTI